MADADTVKAAQDYLASHPEAITFPDWGYGPTVAGNLPSRPVSSPEIGSNAWFEQAFSEYVTWGNITKLGAAGLIVVLLGSMVRK